MKRTMKVFFAHLNIFADEDSDIIEDDILNTISEKLNELGLLVAGEVEQDIHEE